MLDFTNVVGALTHFRATRAAAVGRSANCVRADRIRSALRRGEPRAPRLHRSVAREQVDRRRAGAALHARRQAPVARIHLGALTCHLLRK